MNIAARTASWLPYDAEVEYLQGVKGDSSNCPRIDTGIFGTNDLDFDCEFMTFDTSRDGTTVFGDRYRYNFDGFQLSAYTCSGTGGHFMFGAYSNEIAPSLGMVIGQKGTVSKRGLVMTKVDGTTYTMPTQSSFTTPYQITMFVLGQQNGIGYTEYSGCRIYNLKFYRNNETIADFIPVRVGSVGYMYDRVSRKLFGNAGTGAFIVGPDKT